MATRMSVPDSLSEAQRGRLESIAQATGMAPEGVLDLVLNVLHLAVQAKETPEATGAPSTQDAVAATARGILAALTLPPANLSLDEAKEAIELLRLHLGDAIGAGQRVRVWSDPEAGSVEVFLEEQEGDFQPTSDPRVMECVDRRGRLIGFSIMGLGRAAGIPSEVLLPEPRQRSGRGRTRSSSRSGSAPR